MPGTPRRSVRRAGARRPPGRGAGSPWSRVRRSTGLPPTVGTCPSPRSSRPASLGQPLTCSVDGLPESRWLPRLELRQRACPQAPDSRLLHRIPAFGPVPAVVVADSVAGTTRRRETVGPGCTVITHRIRLRSAGHPLPHHQRPSGSRRATTNSRSRQERGAWDLRRFAGVRGSTTTPGWRRSGWSRTRGPPRGRPARGRRWRGRLGRCRCRGSRGRCVCRRCRVRGRSRDRRR